MGKFHPGQSKPTGSGRAKGRPNNKTFILNSITEDLGVNVPRLIGELLPQLDPGKQVDVLLELMAYLYPKRKAIEHKVEVDTAPPSLSGDELDRELIHLTQALASCEEDPKVAAAYSVIAESYESDRKKQTIL